MRQIFPSPVDEVDVIATYAADIREPFHDRPWLLTNMIASADGGISIDGVSGGLGGPADKRVFTAIRAVADIVLVGAGTVIAENYRRPQTPPEIREQRTARGKAPYPRLAIVTNSLGIDPAHGVFDSDFRPLVVTRSGASADRRAAVSQVADVLDAGEDAVDLATAMLELKKLGAGVVLSEGGPSLNGALAEARLIDELCLTLSPTLIGGDGPRIVKGRKPAQPLGLELNRILHEEGLTFLRFTRR